MALLLDIEPPSPEKDRGDKDNLKTTPNTKAFRDSFTLQSKKILKRLSFFAQNIEYGRRRTKAFFVSVGDNKVLPHIVIGFLFAVVAFSNINDRVQAYNLVHQVNNLDPADQLSIVSDVSSFTPMIQNGVQDVQNAITASSYSGGFVYNAAPTDTQITARTEPLPDNSAGTVYYVVRNGDTLSKIGWEFGVRLATLAYVNDLSNSDLIKPGVRLKVPQRGYEVPASTILAKQQAAATAKAVAAAKAAAKKTAISHPAGSTKNGYPYGYCTYYVATQRAVPSSWGNAGQWLNSAQRAGWSTGSGAVSGAIVVLRESIWGHVAVVESVDGGTMTISEMNAVGWGIVDRRQMSTSDSRIKGFIY